MQIGFGTVGVRRAPLPTQSSLRPIPGQPGLFAWHGQIWRRIGGTSDSPTLVPVAGGAAADPRVPVSAGGSYRPAGLSSALSPTGFTLVLLGTIGSLVALVYLNKDQYANPFER